MLSNSGTGGDTAGGTSGETWIWDGASWQDSPGPLLRLGQLANGSYRLRYQAIDASGNAGEIRELAFAVNPNLPVRRMFLPVLL